MGEVSVAAAGTGDVDDVVAYHGPLSLYVSGGFEAAAPSEKLVTVRRSTRG